jgi:phage baseplate assembly protein W
MAYSLMAYVTELNRQAVTGDRNFLKKMLYFFELHVPPEVARGAAQTEFTFPLVVNPQGYSMGEPFTVEATPTQGGGLYVEENGIVQRTIRLRGHTGWAPRDLKGTGTGALNALTPDQRDWSRTLMSAVADKLSGQRHFQYLQDAVFRTYGQLKKNPATAGGTKLFFHNPRDQESWLVVPQRFELERSAGSQLYQYNIELLAVAPAGQLTVAWDKEDNPVLKLLKDLRPCVKAGIDILAGGLLDLSRLQGELKGVITDIAKIVDGCNGVMGAAQDFLDGTTDLIQSPLAVTSALLDMIDNAVSTVSAAQAIPVAWTDLSKGFVNHALVAMIKGLSLLASHPEAFETPAEIELRKRSEARNPLLTATASETATAEAADPPASLTEVGRLGTTMTPGEVKMAQGDLGAQRVYPRYTGVREYEVAQGDTLVNLAAAFLGDARLWEVIAVANGLRPPFVNEQASAAAVERRSDDEILDGVLGIGEKIIIPNFSQPATESLPQPVLGVKRTEPAPVHLLGRDIALVEEPDGQFEVPIDLDSGRLDVQTRSGIDNLKQAMTSILRTERGTDILYRNVGMRRIIALGLAPADLEILRFRISEAIAADGRIASVRDVELTQPEGTTDQLLVDIQAEVRGFAQPLSLDTTVGA